MGRYAEGTTVSVEKSKMEIEQVLRRYGATSFISGYNDRVAFVLAEVKDRRLRFHVTIPVPADDQFKRKGRTGFRTPQERQMAAAAEERRLWRCLLLSIKSKLEVVESGIESFEQAFLANTVLPNGATVGEWAGPQVEAAYETGTMPSLMPGLGPFQITSGSE